MEEINISGILDTLIHKIDTVTTLSILFNKSYFLQISILLDKS